ncbi:hypothetical protein [Rhodovastum atsumiense]|nr:hypothetical protein [Rhodovastum atsumiense]
MTLVRLWGPQVAGAIMGAIMVISAYAILTWLFGKIATPPPGLR